MMNAVGCTTVAMDSRFTNRKGRDREAMVRDLSSRHYVVMPYSSVDSVDFDDVMEDSRDTVQRSVSGNLTYVSYVGEIPLSVLSVENHSPEYSHSEITELLATPVWTPTEESDE
jgi:hypothetical protein